LSRSTGYGQHGDYVFGWKDDSLQHAMDNRCFGPTCNGLTTQNFDRANKCTVKAVVREDNDGCECSPCFHFLYLLRFLLFPFLYFSFPLFLSLLLSLFLSSFFLFLPYSYPTGFDVLY
jgi:hypothetical protein